MQRSALALSALLLAACSSRAPSAPGPAKSTNAPVAAKKSGSDVLRLVAFEFDPRDGLPDVPADLRGGGGGAYIVQLTERAAASADSLDALKSDLGLSLAEYLSSRAYREYLSDAELSRVRADPRVRAVVEWVAAFKLSATLLAASAERPNQATGGLIVICNPEIDPEVSLTALQSLGLGSVRQLRLPRGMPPRFSIDSASAGEARSIARVPQTIWIEERPSIDEDG